MVTSLSIGECATVLAHSDVSKARAQPCCCQVCQCVSSWIIDRRALPRLNVATFCNRRIQRQESEKCCGRIEVDKIHLQSSHPRVSSARLLIAESCRWLHRCRPTSGPVDGPWPRWRRVVRRRPARVNNEAGEHLELLHQVSSFLLRHRRVVTSHDLLRMTHADP